MLQSQDPTHSKPRIEFKASKSVFKGYLNPSSFLARKEAKVQGIFSDIAKFNIRNLKDKFYGRKVALVASEKEFNKLGSQAKQIQKIRIERKEEKKEKPPRQNILYAFRPRQGQAAGDKKEDKTLNFVLKATTFACAGGQVLLARSVDLHKESVEKFIMSFMNSVHLKADTKYDMNLLKCAPRLSSLNLKLREEQLEKSMKILTRSTTKDTLTLQFMSQPKKSKVEPDKKINDKVLMKYIAALLNSKRIKTCFLNFQMMSISPEFLDWLLTAVGSSKFLDWYISARFNDRDQEPDGPNKDIIELCKKLKGNQIFKDLDVFAVKLERSGMDEFWDSALGGQYHPYYISNSDFRGFLKSCRRKSKILSLVVSYDHGNLINLMEVCKSIPGIYIDYDNALVVEERRGMFSDDEDEYEDEDEKEEKNDEEDGEDEDNVKRKKVQKAQQYGWMKGVENLCIKRQFNDLDKAFYPYSQAFPSKKLEFLHIFDSQVTCANFESHSWSRYNINIPFKNLQGINEVKHLELAYGRKTKIEDLQEMLSRFSGLKKLRLMFCGDYDNDRDCRHDEVEAAKADLLILQENQKHNPDDYAPPERSFPMKIPFGQLVNLIELKIEIPFARCTFFEMNGDYGTRLKGIWWNELPESISKLKLLESLEIIDKNRSKIRLETFMNLLTRLDKVQTLRRLILHTFIVGKQDEKLEPNLDALKDLYQKGAFEDDDDCEDLYDPNEVAFFEQEKEESITKKGQLLNYSDLSEEQRRLQRQIDLFIKNKLKLEEIDIQEVRVGNMNRIKYLK